MCICLLSALLACAGSIEADPPTNIVIILADDLGYGVKSGGKNDEMKR